MELTPELKKKLWHEMCEGIAYWQCMDECLNANEKEKNECINARTEKLKSMYSEED